MGTIANLMVKLGLDSAEFANGMSKAAGQMQSAGQKMSNFGSSLSTTVTAPLVAVGAAAIAAGNQINAGMANVASLGLASDRVAELKGDVQDMAIKVGKSTTDLADGLYQVVSAFGDSADSASILEINAKSAAAGLATTTDAINLTSAVTKGYGDVSAQTVQHAADLAFQTVKLGQTTFPELASSIGKVVPLAASLGVAQEELFGVMATGTGVTGTASEVATQLRGIMQSLMAPTQDMTDLFNSMGYESGQAMLQQLGLQGTIEAMVSAAESTGLPLQKYISSIEGQTLAMALAGPQAETFTEKLAAMNDVTGAANDAFAAQSEGINKTGFTMQQAAIKGQVLLEKLSDGLAPALSKLLDLAAPWIDKLIAMADNFANADESTQTWIVTIGAVVAAIGPLLMVLGTVVSSIGSVVGALATIASPIGLVIGAVAGLALAYTTNFMGIRDVTNRVVGGIKDIFEGFYNILIGGREPLGDWFYWWEQLTDRFGEGFADKVVRIGEILYGLRRIIAGFYDILIGGSEPLGDWSYWWEKIEGVFGSGIADKIVTIGELFSALYDILVLGEQPLGDWGKWYKQLQFSFDAETSDKIVKIGVAISDLLGIIKDLVVGNIGASDALVAAWAQIKTGATIAFGLLGEYIRKQLPIWIEILAGWRDAAWEWIVAAVPIVLTKVGEYATMLLQFLGNQIPKLLAMMVRYATAIVDWIGNAQSPVTSSLGDWISNILQWGLGVGLPALIGLTLKFAWALIKWIALDLIPQVVPELLKFGLALLTALAKLAASLALAALDIGLGIIKGIVKGIMSGVSAIATAAKDAALGALNAAKSALGIHSPSSVAADEIGEPFGEGIGVGAARAIDGLTGALGNRLDALMGGLQPTPAAAGAGPAMSIQLTQNFYGQADAATVEGASRNGITSALRQVGMR